MNSKNMFNLPASIHKEIALLKNRPALYWEKLGQRHAMNIFQHATKNVTAYKKLLRSRKISISSIKSIKDFAHLPVTDKDNFLRKFQYKELLPQSDFSLVDTFSATSGSTGEPFYLPRNETGNLQYQYFSEVFLVDQFEIDRKKTLIVLGFGFGMWIAGISTYTYLHTLAKKGYPITIIPAGPNIAAFLGSIKKFGSHYEQIVIFGYPPLLKDILDEGRNFGVHWKDYRLRIVTSGEGFSEEFRNYIAGVAKLRDPHLDMVGVYGSTELGGMAHETPLSVAIRKLAHKNKKVYSALFPETKSLPTLAQYHPQIIYLEEQEGEILATGNASTIPLIRYRFPDRGGVIPYEEMSRKLQNVGVDMKRLLTKSRGKLGPYKLPFVYVSERSDGAVLFYGINIYPESIKVALLKKNLSQYVTGKFFLEKKMGANMRENLNIHVELKSSVTQSKEIRRIIYNTLISVLRTRHSEYNHLFLQFHKKAEPRILLHEYHNKQYFEIGKKHKWVNKFVV